MLYFYKKFIVSLVMLYS